MAYINADWTHPLSLRDFADMIRAEGFRGVREDWLIPDGGWPEIPGGLTLREIWSEGHLTPEIWRYIAGGLPDGADLRQGMREEGEL